jgi:hypothetical protein
MTDTKYNGWTNYPTWAWNLWIDNDEGSQAYAIELAETAWAEARLTRAYDGQTREQSATAMLADMLEQDADDRAYDLVSTAGPFSDMLSWALGQINWHEIAEHFISDLDKSDDEDEDDD